VSTSVGDAETVVAAMSGGVDSSVAAALLLREGFRVVGVTLRVWPSRRPVDPAHQFDSCCSPAAADDARAVADHLGIPHYVLNYEAEFDREVAKMAHLSEGDQEKLRRIAASMVRSLLRNPTEALKDEPDASRRMDRAEAARHLFGLDRPRKD